MLLQHDLDRSQPFRDALGVVQAIDADGDRLGPVAVQDPAHLVGHLRSRGQTGEEVEVDADRVGGQPDLPARHGDPPLAPDIAMVGQRRDGVDEVAGVGIQMEADQVRCEHSGEQLLGVRLDLVDLVAGEGDVKEKGDAGLRQPLTHHRGEQHQMVVVDPDQVPVAVFPGDRLGELLVDLDVRFPLFVVELAVLLEVVKQRPQRLVRVPQVVLLDLVTGELHRT